MVPTEAVDVRLLHQPSALDECREHGVLDNGFGSEGGIQGLGCLWSRGGHDECVSHEP